MVSTVIVESPVVQLGSQGQAVIDLQVLLNKRVAAKLRVDGIFGTKTEDAVKTTQSIFFLEIDGIAGSKTWTVLRTNEPIEMPVLKRGSKGDLVRRVQAVLKEASYDIGNLDGEFGALTEAAVTEFQNNRKWSVNKLGVIDQQTWKGLVSLATFFALD
jgi:peptidoglycan hydrolase-like protein with peptidoglycan-binding domain